MTKLLECMLVQHEQMGLGVVDKEDDKGVWCIFIGYAPKVCVERKSLILLECEQFFIEDIKELCSRLQKID